MGIWCLFLLIFNVIPLFDTFVDKKRCCISMGHLVLGAPQQMQSIHIYFLMEYQREPETQREK